MHLEIFADRLVVIVPAGIGVAVPFAGSGGFVRPLGCSYPLRTVNPTGVIEVQSGRTLMLAQVFRLWQQPLSNRRLLSFVASSRERVRAYVNGREWLGDPGGIPLVPHEEVVLEVGGFVRPHTSFVFPRGL